MLEGGACRTLPAVHADNWKIAGCPVNGPAIAAAGNAAVVAWYSAANDVPKVQIARSTDASDRCPAPVAVDAGAEAQGPPDWGPRHQQAPVPCEHTDSRRPRTWPPPSPAARHA